MKALNRGYYVPRSGAIIAFVAAMLAGCSSPARARRVVWFFACGIVGVVTSLSAFVCITQYYTEYRYRPVQSIAEACQTGPATNIIAGFAVGLECTFFPVLVISAAILLSYWMGSQA